MKNQEARNHARRNNIIAAGIACVLILAVGVALAIQSQGEDAREGLIRNLKIEAPALDLDHGDEGADGAGAGAPSGSMQPERVYGLDFSRLEAYKDIWDSAEGQNMSMFDKPVVDRGTKADQPGGQVYGLDFSRLEATFEVFNELGWLKDAGDTSVFDQSVRDMGTGGRQ